MLENLSWQKGWQKNWQTENDSMPKDVESWLFDDNSLTAKLKNIYPKFRVEVVQESLKNGNLQREVNLCDDKTPLVYAISLIPTSCTKLQNLGNTPLGEILFQNGKRLEITTAKDGENWGRKSIFAFENHHIIVCEFFLPTLFT